MILPILLLLLLSILFLVGQIYTKLRILKVNLKKPTFIK